MSLEWVTLFFLALIDVIRGKLLILMEARLPALYKLETDYEVLERWVCKLLICMCGCVFNLETWDTYYPKALLFKFSFNTHIAYIQATCSSINDWETTKPSGSGDLMWLQFCFLEDFILIVSLPFSFSRFPGVYLKGKKYRPLFDYFVQVSSGTCPTWVLHTWVHLWPIWVSCGLCGSPNPKSFLVVTELNYMCVPSCFNS